MNWRLPVIVILCSTVLVLYMQRNKNGTDWDSTTRGYILGSFYWGYVLTQIPGGILCLKFGPKWVIFTSLLGSSLLDLSIPLVTLTSYHYLIALRIIQGMFQGVIMPSAICLLSNWCPPNERSRYTAMITVGTQLGTIIGQTFAGIISQSYEQLDSHQSVSHWPYVHYSFGCIGLAICLTLATLISSKPREHRWISRRETVYIVTSIYKQSIQLQRDSQNGLRPLTDAELEDEAVRQTNTNQLDDSEPSSSKPSLKTTPWLTILRSRAVWPIFACHFAFNWSWYTLITCMPTYMNSVHKVDILKNGIMSSMPYLLTIVTAQSIGFISDCVISRGLLSITWTRRINNSIALTGSGVGLVLVGLVGTNRAAAITLFTLAVGTLGLGSSGFPANAIDLSPVYSGTIISLSNTLATLPGFFGPMLVGYLTDSGNAGHSWLIIFIVTACISGLATLVNLLLTDGQPQPWGLIGPRQVGPIDSLDDSEQGGKVAARQDHWYD